MSSTVTRSASALSDDRRSCCHGAFRGPNVSVSYPVRTIVRMSGGARGGVAELNIVDLDTTDPDPTYEVAWVTAVLDAAAHAPLDAVDDEVLSARAVTLEAARRKLDAAFARTIAELDTRGVCDRDHGLQTGTWLAREANEPIGPSRRRARMARRLRDDFPVLDTALADGKIGWAHIEVIVGVANPRIADQIAALCPELVNLAGEWPFAPWRTEVVRIAHRLDVDGGYDPTRDETANRLFLARTLGDVLDVRGAFVGEHAAVAQEAIEREADRLFRHYTKLAKTTGGETTVPDRATSPRPRVRRALSQGRRRGHRRPRAADRPDRGAPRRSTR